MEKRTLILDTKLMSAVMALDLNNTRNRLYIKGNHSLEDVDNAIIFYRRFLYLCVKYPDTAFAPTPEVDEVWHDHILHTEKYMRDCTDIAGTFIHHTPFVTKLSEVFEEIPDKNSHHNPNFSDYCEMIWEVRPFEVSTAQTCDKCTVKPPSQSVQTCDKCTVKPAPQRAQTCDKCTVKTAPESAHKS